MEYIVNKPHLLISLQENQDKLAQLLEVQKHKITYVTRGISEGKEQVLPLDSALFEVPYYINNVLFYVYNNKELITSFRLQEFPFCCGFMVSGNVYVQSKYQHYGIGTMMNILRCDMAASMQFISLICTVVKGNAPQTKILVRNGWSLIMDGNNLKTQNDVEMWQIKLQRFRDEFKKKHPLLV